MSLYRQLRRWHFVNHAKHTGLDTCRFLRRIGRNPSPEQWEFFRQSTEAKAAERWPA